MPTACVTMKPDNRYLDDRKQRNTEFQRPGFTSMRRRPASQDAVLVCEARLHEARPPLHFSATGVVYEPSFWGRLCGIVGLLSRLKPRSIARERESEGLGAGVKV